MGRLEELALKPVLVLKKSTTLRDAARALYKKEVGCALVSDQKGHIIGIVTDRDIGCSALANNCSPEDPVAKVMSTALISVSDEADLSEAVELMKDFGIRRLPVIRTQSGGKQKCIGMLSMDDLILSQAVKLEDLSEIVANQILPVISFEVRKSEAAISVPISLENH